MLFVKSIIQRQENEPNEIIGKDCKNRTAERKVEADLNILFFLTPKSDVAYVTNEYSLRQVLEKMEFHRYSAIPMLDKNGRYVGTITEGDLLWGIKNEAEMNMRDAEKIPITKIPRRIHNTAVNVNAEVESLIKVAMTQNFVPVTDDNDIFIGIVKRSDIMDYCFKKIRQQAPEKEI